MHSLCFSCLPAILLIFDHYVPWFLHLPSVSLSGMEVLWVQEAACLGHCHIPGSWLQALINLLNW